MDKAGEVDSLQYDRSPCFLNAVAVDLPWGRLLGSGKSERKFRISEMLAGVLIGRRAKLRASQALSQ